MSSIQNGRLWIVFSGWSFTEKALETRPADPSFPSSSARDKHFKTTDWWRVRCNRNWKTISRNEKTSFKSPRQRQRLSARLNIKELEALITCAGVTKSLQFIIQPTKYNVVYSRYFVNHLTWIPIKMPFLGRRKPVDIKALRKAVWALAPKQATYTEINKLHFRIWNTRVKK